MPATLRNGKVAGSPTKMDKTSSPSSPSKSSYLTPATPRPSPYLLLAYPTILALGSLYALISPYATTRNIPANPIAGGIASTTTAPSSTQLPSYFAGKHNLINTLFVKRGWAWTTLVFIFLQLTTRVSSSTLTARESLRTHYLRAFLRYALVTTAWVFVTQWFFGPALIDRSFTLTGGHCEGLPSQFSDPETAREAMVKVATVYSSSACKRSGGSWRGGHDISGHCFMLVLSSAFLLYERSIADRHSAHPSVSPGAARAVARGMTEDERKAVGGWETEEEASWRVYARYALGTVVGLDLLMLFTTAVWFHTWLEKVNGMLIAGSVVWGVYFLGDFVKGWRYVVGGL